MIQTLGEIPKPVHVKGIEPIPPYYTPLGIDGKPAKFLKAKPKTKSNCDHCDLCVKVCPRNYQRAAKNEIFVSDGRENEIQ